ncbi:MAG: acyl carrier protein [Synergistaceae bacterium]|jgi:acyl carrier protein|nr:acyl carrier protein [Synergistaceae bacterium]
MRDKIIEIARSILGDNASEATSMGNMPSWDSLKTLQIVMALDEAGISVPFERIAEIRALSDIIEMAGD